MRKVSRDHVSKKMLALSRPLPQQTVLMSIVDSLGTGSSRFMVAGAGVRKQP